MTVIRIVIYKGTQERMEKQLSQGLNDGVHDLLVTIGVVTIPSAFGLRRLFRAFVTLWKEVRRAASAR